MSKWEVTLRFESAGDKARPTVAEKNEIVEAIRQLVCNGKLDVKSYEFLSVIPLDYFDDENFTEDDDA